MRRRARGFTLVEILIALGLAGITSAFLLMIARSQLLAFQMNDGISRAQGNARAGMDYLETMLRRACGGIGNGEVGINVGAAQSLQPCLKVWDGAALSGGSFTTGDPAKVADAVEVIYGAAPYTQLSAAPAFPTVTVADATGFAKGDFVLITNFQGMAELFRIATVSGTIGGTLTFESPGESPVAMPALGAVPAYVPASGDGVLKAQSLSVYRSTANDNTNGMLMLDPDGMVGTDHKDAQPLVEAAADFQLAIGVDADNNGLIGATEWEGDQSGELPANGSIAPLPWNAEVAQPLVRQIRVTLLSATTMQFLGQPAPPTVIEDATGASYLTPIAGAPVPRYRALSTTVAPRAWNPLN